MENLGRHGNEDVGDLTGSLEKTDDIVDRERSNMCVNGICKLFWQAAESPIWIDRKRVAE